MKHMMIGTSDAWLMSRSSLWPSVLYWRLSDFYSQLAIQLLKFGPLSDADDCRRICEHGAKKLGYGSYQHYIRSHYDLSDDSGSD